MRRRNEASGDRELMAIAKEILAEQGAETQLSRVVIVGHVRWHGVVEIEILAEGHIQGETVDGHGK